MNVLSPIRIHPCAISVNLCSVDPACFVLQALSITYIKLNITVCMYFSGLWSRLPQFWRKWKTSQRQFLWWKEQCKEFQFLNAYYLFLLTSCTYVSPFKHLKQAEQNSWIWGQNWGECKQMADMWLGCWQLKKLLSQCEV